MITDEKQNTQEYREGSRGLIVSGLKKLIDALGKFLSRFRWQVFANPSFRHPVTTEYAKRAIEDWVSDVGPETYAFAGVERGPVNGQVHCHVLLGGIRDDNAVARASRFWQRGNIVAESYDPSRGACWYASKLPGEGVIIGNLKRLPRRKRGRKKHKQEGDN